MSVANKDVLVYNVRDPSIANELVKEFFTLRWTVTVPDIALTPISVIEQFGTYTSGDRDLDRRMATNPVHIACTIPEIIKHFSNRTPIRIVDSRDAKRIYDRCYMHLKSWHYYNESYPVNTICPVADLSKIKEFATKVFRYVDLEKFDEFDESLFVKDLQQGLDFTSMFNPNSRVFAKQTEEVEYIPPAAPHEDFNLEDVGRRVTSINRGYEKWK